MRAQQGYRITTPLRTLVDVIEEGVLFHDLLLQALTEALQRGIVSRKNIEATPDGSKIRDVFKEIKV